MVYRPTARVLSTLELLQVHGKLTGAELADRLEVDRRTVRKYVETLRDLGVPIEAARGRAGAYRLRPGTRLPPLMFSQEETVALVLGLLIAQRSGVSGTVHLPAVLAKIERVLPEETRAQVEAVASSAGIEPLAQKPAPLPGTISELAAAATSGRRVLMTYASGSGDQSQREFNCFGVGYCDDAWYAIGYCHMRQDKRLFRMDRIAAVTPLETRFTPPSDYVAMREIQAALATVPREWAVSVVVRAPVDEVRATIALSPGHFSACDAASTRVAVDVDDLRWMARLLAGSGLPFDVESPDELRDAVQDYAAELLSHVSEKNAGSEALS